MKTNSTTQNQRHSSRSDLVRSRCNGLACNEKAKICAFLEFIRPMGSRDGASKQPDWYTGADWSLDWAQEKDLAINTRYAHHLEFIFGYHRERGEEGLQSNTTSRSVLEDPQSRKLGRADSRNQG